MGWVAGMTGIKLSLAQLWNGGTDSCYDSSDVWTAKAPEEFNEIDIIPA